MQNIVKEEYTLGQIVGVISNLGKTKYFFSEEELEIGDKVIVEDEEEVDYGEVIKKMKEDILTVCSGKKLGKVIRKVGEEDFKKIEELEKKEEEAYYIAKEKIQKHNLPMELSNVIYSFDEKRIVFNFTAEKRVDFRELLKDLVATFKCRIELHQIGVRDEAKKISGYGPCGYSLCCTKFLKEFIPVSLRMAKDQGLPINPSKITGVCGRLLCCLSYEQQNYLEEKEEVSSEDIGAEGGS